MSTPVEQIKGRLDIVEVISPYVKLTRAGKHFKGLSPFNKEKTPSFFVSPDRGAYYCFSSHKGGDIFTFIQEMEGLDFRGALELLARKAGVELVYESKEKKDARERLFLAHEEATHFFERNLKEREDIQKYVFERGITKETISSWRLGYAPEDWRALKEYLTKRGYSEEELKKAGLIKEGEKGGHSYDRFRNRIVFPFFDASGRVIAFSGRIAPGADESAAKYLNSPETELFDKSRVLYGYDRARTAIRKFNFVILVEGQVDLVLSHQAGYSNTVAVSGTGLTSEHLRLVSRFTKNLLMAFDADKAGLASSARGARLALRAGMDVKVPKLPQGVDPADLIHEGKDKWKEAIKHAKHIIDFYLELISKTETDGRKLKLRVERGILPFVALLQSKIDQEHFISRIASFLEVPSEAVRDELEKIKQEAKKEVEREHRREGRGEGGTKVEAQIDKVEEPKASSRKIFLRNIILGLILWQGDEKVLNIKELKGELDAILEEEVTTEILSETEKAQYAFQAEISFQDTPALSEDVQALLVELKKECSKEKRALLSEEIKQAEKKNDEKEAQRLLEEYKKLSDRLTA
ncbi:MAG: DNA primase [Candidatus Paceibacterota bacterium]